MQKQRVCSLITVILYMCTAAIGATAAPMSTARIEQLEKVYADQLIGVPMGELETELPRNRYVVDLVNRLHDLGFYTGKKLANGRAKDNAIISAAQMAAANYYAEVVGLPHTWGSIEPLTFVYLMDEETTVYSPTAILNPLQYRTITHRSAENDHVRVALTVERVEMNGNQRIYAGHTEENNDEWIYVLNSTPSEIEPEMIIGDKVFAFGRIAEINLEAKIAVINAELVAFQAE